MIQKMNLTWKDIEDNVNNLVAQLKDQHFDAVVSIGRGGMIPARLLAEKLDIHSAYIVDVRAYDEDNKLDEVKIQDVKFAADVHKILVVDDCIFTGTTLDTVMEKVAENEQITDIVNVFLYKNSRCAYDMSDYIYGTVYDGDSIWLVFPWESK